MEDNKIITFANRKGGVGKSSLCFLFAHFLAERSHNVQILDMDPQQSLVKKRAIEVKNTKNAQEPYKIISLGMSNAANTEQFMKQLSNTPGTFLIDLPGSLELAGIDEVLIHSDYIITPIDYEYTVIAATVDFVERLLFLKESYQQDDPTILFVPNRFKKNYGKTLPEETEKQTEEMFNELGKLMPAVGEYADLFRASSLKIGYRARNHTFETFDKIYSEIYEQ